MQGEGRNWIPSSFYFHQKDEVDFVAKYVSIWDLWCSGAVEQHVSIRWNITYAIKLVKNAAPLNHPIGSS